jgi:hypothetical protein
VYNNLIKGNVIGDFDNDCAFDTGSDVRMRNITVTANIDTNVFLHQQIMMEIISLQLILMVQ